MTITITNTDRVEVPFLDAGQQMSQLPWTCFKVFNWQRNWKEGKPKNKKKKKIKNAIE